MADEDRSSVLAVVGKPGVSIHTRVMLDIYLAKWMVQKNLISFCYCRQLAKSKAGGWIVVTTLLVSSVNSNGKKPTTDEYFQNFCREIVNRHYFIRSASIADNVGHLMATASRHRLVPLITYEDSSRAATQPKRPQVTNSNQR